MFSKGLVFLSLCMMNVSAVGNDDNLPNRSCDDSVSATCVEYSTRTLESVYPTDLSSSNRNSGIQNSMNRLGVLSLIGYLLF